MRKGLLDGSLGLMGGGKLPVAVDQAGKIVGQARVASMPGASATSAGVGAGAGAGALALTAGAWPMIVGAGAATAAVVAQQRWLESTFAGLADRLDRIETRLRDDDLGALDGADRLVELLSPVGLAFVPSQLQIELAVARRQVDGIYFSRQRFVERVKRAIEAQQVAEEGKSGKRLAWAGDIAERLADGGVVDEIVVFVRAMVSRARLAAVTASLLATESPGTALALLDSIDGTMRHDYWDLQRRLMALARARPESQILRRFVDRGQAERAVLNTRSLSDVLSQGVGERLPERDTLIELDLPASVLVG